MICVIKTRTLAGGREEEGKRPYFGEENHHQGPSGPAHTRTHTHTKMEEIVLK